MRQSIIALPLCLFYSVASVLSTLITTVIALQIPAVHMFSSRHTVLRRGAPLERIARRCDVHRVRHDLQTGVSDVADGGSRVIAGSVRNATHAHTTPTVNDTSHTKM